MPRERTRLWISTELPAHGTLKAPWRRPALERRMTPIAMSSTPLAPSEWHAAAAIVCGVQLVRGAEPFSQSEPSWLDRQASPAYIGTIQNCGLECARGLWEGQRQG
jgi:hypothetical protein